MSYLRQEISALNATAGTADAEKVAALNALDVKVGTHIYNYSIGVREEDAWGKLDQAVWDDIRDRMNDPNHIYACYAGYSHKDRDQ